jgi:sensor domain CHASE-containing protein
MELYIVIVLLFVLSIVIAVLYGVAKEKTKTAEQQLKLGDKIDKILSANSCLPKHEWVNWLQDKRRKQK